MPEESTNGMTPFSIRCEILGELWLTYRGDEEFEEFIEYNDLGLPLAYAISEKLVVPTAEAESLINESWSLLLEGLETEDTGFDTIDDLLDS